MNWRIFFCCVAFGPAPILEGTVPKWYQQPASELRLQSSQTVTEAGDYYQQKNKVIVNPALAAFRPASLELAFAKGTRITGITFEVAAGGRLVFKDAVLNGVGVICQPGGEVQFENCAMMRLYLAASPGYSGSGSPAPSVVMTDSFVSQSHIESPISMGLTAKNCRIVLSDVEATVKDATNTNTSITDSIFSECKLLTGEVLLCTTRCWFSQCEIAGELTKEFASYLPQPVVVKVAWNGRYPDALPQKAGMVFFEPADYTKVQNAGTREGGPSMSDPVQSNHSLAGVVPLVDALGMMPSMTPANPSASAAETTVVAAGLAFKARLSSVNGLLISQLASGEEAGQVTKMSLTALPSLGTAPSTLKFNQAVGNDMQKALSEVSKFTQIRHGGLPSGHAIEVGFEDKYIAKDGPSAAVACALLLEAAITGKKWDPAFAVTGDMNADGSVQPIGGVQAKIRGATKGSCKLVGVPVKNEKAVQDLLVLEGPAPLVGITVFGIKTFEEALLLADTERPQALQNALTNFDSMRTVMMRDPRQIMPLLRTPHAAQRLQALLAAAPNCYSAKYLLLYVQNRMPRTLSIGGSIEAAQGSAVSILAAIEHDVDTNMSSLKGDELGSSLNRLRTLRPLLDPRVWPYVDNLVAYGDVVRGSVLNPVRSGARYADLVSKAAKAAGAAKAAYDKLLSDAQVREELGL